MENITLGPGDALLVVDIQNDFLPGGALGVAGGDEIIPLLNRYLAIFAAKGLPIIASRDWHPEHHCSFKEEGGPWPVHCVAESFGAAFSALIEFPAGIPIVSKATEREKEAYSAFDGTGLDEIFRRAKVKRIFIGGLTTDYCVVSSVRDARRLDYSIVVLHDAVRAVNLHPGDERAAIEEIVCLGGQLAEIGQIS